MRSIGRKPLPFAVPPHQPWRLPVHPPSPRGVREGLCVERLRIYLCWPAGEHRRRVAHQRRSLQRRILRYRRPGPTSSRRPLAGSSGPRSRSLAQLRSSSPARRRATSGRSRPRWSAASIALTPQSEGRSWRAQPVSACAEQHQVGRLTGRSGPCARQQSSVSRHAAAALLRAGAVISSP